MKKTLAFMVMALALLLTQCRKPSIDFPTPSVTTTVSMTITAGPGSKTDITTEGGIVWSENDKIYVGDGSKYVGCLAIMSGVGNATGTFTGDVTVATGDDCTFHFYYLGHDNGVVLAANATEATVDFSNQNIYADNGKLKNASGQHVGYGKAEHVKVEADKPVTGLQVSMKSKVAIAYFCFQKGEGESATPYTGALTLSGDHIYNKMTVNFGDNDFSFSGTKGDISLTNTTTHLKYAMLVPTNSTAEEILNFGGGATGSTTLANGIEANKFYRIDGNMPIEVTVKPIEFTVNKAADTKVTFAPGNLWYGKAEGETTAAFHFEANQWDFRTYNDGTKKGGSCIGGVYNASSGTPRGDWGLFGWSTGAANNNWGMHTKTSSTTGYTNGDFKNWGTAPGLPSAGDGKTWRTLSFDEWKNLLGIDGAESPRDNAASLRAWVTLDNGVSGVVILPDGSDATASDVTTTALVASSGAVFLPAAGSRNGTDVSQVGTFGYYWSSTLYGASYAYRMLFSLGGVTKDYDLRYFGRAVRLVR